MFLPTQFLKFADEAEWRTVAQEVGVLTIVEIEDPETEESTLQEVWKHYTRDWAVDTVGIIYNDDAVFDDEGELVTPATARDGYHINVKWTVELPAALTPYIVAPTPATPKRIFLGD